MPAPRLDTPERVPLLSVVLGYGPTGLILLLGLFAWLGQPWALTAGRLWSAAILVFLAGVARGLSFFTEGGPRPAQLAATMLRFGCGLLALAIWLPGAFALLVLGYASVIAYDPFAARHGEAPRYFARLRPPQVAVALVGLALLWTRSLGWA